MSEFNSWIEREEDATYTTYVKSQQSYHPHSSGRIVYACILLYCHVSSYFTDKQRSRLNITLYVAVVASIVSITVKGRRKKYVHTRRSPESLIPHACHVYTLTSMETATFLSHTFQHIHTSLVLVNSSICHCPKAPNKR